MTVHRAIASVVIAAGLCGVAAAHVRAAVDSAPSPRGMGAPQIDPIQSQIITPSTEPPAIGLGPLPVPAGPRELRGNPLWSVPLKNLNATRERPIFLPSRRAPAPAVAGAPPAVVAPPPPPPAEPDRPRLALVGAVSGESEGIAVFMDEATRDIVRLRTGENHAGWILRSVRGREATLEKGPETAILALPDPLAPPGAPGVPGPPGRKSSEPEL
jgi:general secretion pathway protein N